MIRQAVHLLYAWVLTNSPFFIIYINVLILCQFGDFKPFLSDCDQIFVSHLCFSNLLLLISWGYLKDLLNVRENFRPGVSEVIP